MATDYISREAAIEKARNLYPSIDHYCTSVNAVPIRDLNAIPAAEVEPVVHAHWIRRFCDHRNDYLDVLEYPYRCSWCRVKNKELTKRCPECGARMDEKVSER